MKGDHTIEYLNLMKRIEDLNISKIEKIELKRLLLILIKKGEWK